DAMGDAVVVFAQDGTLAMVNAAARTLWGDEIGGFIGLDTEDSRKDVAALGVFRRQSAPTLLWAELRDYIGSFAPRDPWEGELRLLDGRALSCRISPMPHGSTLVSFRITGAFPAMRLDALRERPAQKAAPGP